nr:ABC transporter substrate binding protein [Sedimentibacter sp.]
MIEIDRTKRNKINMIVFLIILFSIFSINTVYCAEVNKNVLFISSYDQNFATVPEQIEGIQSVFNLNKINLDLEYMDTKRFDTDENVSNFYQLIKYKMNNLETYDAVIVGDDSALQFAIDNRDSLFKNLPVIFLGINDINRAKYANEYKNMTGIIEETSIKENIEIAMKFNKNAKRVVAIIDNTLTGVGDREQFYSIKNDFKQLKFDDINVSQYTFKELEEILEKIDKETILLYLTMFTDKTGQSISIDEAVDILREHTHVPVYRTSIGGIGQGLLGGKLVSYKKMGEISANMVLSILNGEPAGSIDMIYDTPHIYFFDYNIMKKYNIDEKLIPKDAIFINEKVNSFEQNKEAFLTLLPIISFLIIILTVLIIDNIKRRKIEKALTDSNIKLGETYEELAVSEEELRVQYDTIQDNIDEIRKLNERYELAIESTNSAVWDINLNSNEIYISKNFVSIMDITDFELKDVNRLLGRVLNVNDRKFLEEQYEDYKNGTKSEINLQLPIEIGDGSKKWILLIGRGYSDANQTSNIIHGIILDITQMKEQEDKIEYLAHHDYLTNLPNRIQFSNRLKEELQNKKSGAVLLLDIDNFKGINDTLGHAYGDEVLKEISLRLKSIVNDCLFVSRFGGDEFLILISDIYEISDINKYVNQIVDLFNDSFKIDSIENYIQFSIGITRFPNDGDNIHQLIANADTAMYKAKNSGKNISKIFSNDMKDELTSKAEIEYILRDALKNNGFTLLYQPQVDVETSRVIGFEALIRLKNYEIYPSTFINIAEENGLILDIGRWVTKEAVEQLAIWRNKGLELKPISINFSSKQLRDTGYIEFLSETLSNNDIGAKYIEIEITESILFEKTEKSLEFLNELKDMGVKISLDDFGTGFSSLSYLTYIPVNKIKLDKSLCDKFLELNNVNVIDNIISLAHSLNLEVTAEGIERPEQYKRLRTIGCNYIQGYLFSKPVCVEVIEKIYL